ncbi:MAG: response regulator, partial [Chloroflexi bacterium]|nr:response regulator [Chloroflexota bacterium]
KITVDDLGEFLELNNSINTMVDQMLSFASEVTRVAREVGTEGKLGGQAQVGGVSGTWKDLTDNVNFMAANLTNQVRGIARVVTAVANGDLKQKLTVEAKGEIAALSDTINSMIDTLATFADQVTTVAREVGVEGRLGGQANVPGAAGTWRDLTDNVNRLAANLTTQVRAIAEVAIAVTRGDLTRSVQVDASGEVAVLKDNVNQMIANLRETTQVNAEQDWLKTNVARFTRMLQGQRDLITVAQRILSELAPVVSAEHGVFYSMGAAEGGEPELKLLAGYALEQPGNVGANLKLGQGLVGQCAAGKQRILVDKVPGDYIRISSGLGSAPPMAIVVLPIIFEGQVKAVLELASFDRFSAVHLAFLEQLAESIGIVLNTIEATMRTEALLKQSQSLAEELQQTNNELEEKARLLVEQKAEVEAKNAEVERARQALEEKAEQLALTSKYKSEFLSNMSHELRTPLNSLLILSQQLSENLEGNLVPKQVEFARTIHSAGTDLLTLINDILDLSKIESGTVTLDLGDLRFRDLGDYVERTFRHVAVDKGLDFLIELDPNLPASIFTDAKRLQQILKNLLSNAFKFTARGEVVFRVEAVKEGWAADNELLSRDGSVIAFSVRDTGIGIPRDKQQLIFEAFQQADGTTSRKYGGTGLGLSISRELTRLLNGEIHLASTPGQGSIFTLYVPQTYTLGPTAGRSEEPETERVPWVRPSTGQTRSVIRPVPGIRWTDDGPPALAEPHAGREQTALIPARAQLGDSRDDILPSDRVLLIVEDDPSFARILLDMAHANGFKALVALRGSTALALAHELNPDAITLDINLPEMDGWKLLDHLKDNPSTRHIPVHIISVEEEQERALRKWALAYLTKPVSKDTLEEAFAHLKRYLERDAKNLLVVEDDDRQRAAIIELVGGGDVNTVAVASGAEALEVLRGREFDCLVLDLLLPDMSGFAVIEATREELGLRTLPIIVYTGKELTKEESARLERMADSIIVKDVRSPERLLDETALFLHRVAARLPEAKRRMLEQLHQTDAVLAGRKVLIVDDDIRNIFALTGVLERHKIAVVSADNGREAIRILQETPDIDLVLMDIMMPEMDGYATTRAIREIDRFQSLPIVALTAKAMKGDRQKCLDAGASDYVAKPVDTDQLLSLLRVWLYR